MHASAGSGPDERPLVEVTDLSRDGAQWRAVGTACVPEGTLYAVSYDGKQPDFCDHTTASEGGPGRGHWELIVRPERIPAQLIVTTEDMESGGTLSRATVAIDIVEGYGA